MKIVIIGASTGVGRALAEEAGLRGHDVVLVATDSRDLTALAAHVRIVHNVSADIVPWHFGPDSLPVSEFLDRLRSAGRIDAVFFPIGAARDDDTGCLPEAAGQGILESNFTAIVSVISGMLNDLQTGGKRYLVGFGSVAAIRGRSQNVVYAAAKRALESYFESLQHLLSKTEVRAQLYILGFIDTPRIAGKKVPLQKCSPNAVAKAVFSNLDSNVRTTYFPRYWRAIAFVLRKLPWFLYRNLRGTS